MLALPLPTRTEPLWAPSISPGCLLIASPSWSIRADTVTGPLNFRSAHHNVTLGHSEIEREQRSTTNRQLLRDLMIMPRLPSPS